MYLLQRLCGIKLCVPRVCGDTLRLHILANSDTVEDQLLKLQVRDAAFGTGDSRNAVCRNQAAGGADPAHSHAGPAAHSPTDAAPAGSSQQVQCRLEEIPFAARRYSGFWLPAGTYTALRIELGSAQGHNWFCVLYPALCVGSSEARYADTEENALVFGGYQVRFALLDTARSVWQKITD